jgi:Helix-hairpin-helix motif
MRAASVDPTDLPAFMTPEQLEWWILFGICVAGKNANQTRVKLNALLEEMYSQAVCARTPFAAVRAAIRQTALDDLLRKHKTGKYALYAKAFPVAVKIDTQTRVTVGELMQVPGIGPKTARMIVLYAYPDATCVPLDTHVLKFLRTLGYDAPTSTPADGTTYLLLEAAFVAEAKKRKKTVRELDTIVWKFYSGN